MTRLLYIHIYPDEMILSLYNRHSILYTYGHNQQRVFRYLLRVIKRQALIYHSTTARFTIYSDYFTCTVSLQLSNKASDYALTAEGVSLKTTRAARFEFEKSAQKALKGGKYVSISLSICRIVIIPKVRCH